MAPRTEVLTFKSGKRLRVSVSLTGKMLVKEYLMDLKEAIGSQPVYPPDLVVADGVTLQNGLYQDLKWYYQAIADNLSPPVNTEELDPLCRHQFFICGEPVPHWEDPNVEIPDLSNLEKLLGHSYPEPGTQITEPVSTFEPPSADYDAYMIAALVINFPNSGLEMADRFDSDFLNKVLKDAAHLSDPDKIDKPNVGGAVSFKQTHQVDEDFEANKEAIRLQLAAIGVSVPEDFN